MLVAASGVIESVSVAGSGFGFAAEGRAIGSCPGQEDGWQKEAGVLPLASEVAIDIRLAHDKLLGNTGR